MDVFGGVVGRSDAPRRRQYCARMVSIIRCEILATLNCLSVQSVQESEDAKARMHDAQIYLFGAEGQAHYEIGLWFLAQTLRSLRHLADAQFAYMEDAFTLVSSGV